MDACLSIDAAVLCLQRPLPYLPRMIDIRIGKIKASMPQTWNELTRKQVKRIVRIAAQEMPEEERRQRIFLAIWVRHPMDWRRIRTWTKLLDEHTRLLVSHETEEAAVLAAEVDALLDLAKPFIESLTLTRNHLPLVRVFRRGRWQKLIGPEDELRGITGGEFAWAERAAMNYQRERKRTHLVRLAAILWRPKRKDYHPARHNDPRIPFRIESIEWVEKFTDRLSAATLLYIYHFYLGCRLGIVEQPGNRRIFSEDNAGKSRKRNYGWLDVWLEMGNGVLHVDEVAARPLDLLLIEINRNLDKQEEAERQARKMKNRRP